MIDRISEYVVRKLRESNIIKEEDIELYQFGIESFLMKACHLISYLVIGLLFGRLPELLLFLAAFIPLRECSGGYHAKTPLRCYILSCCTVIAFLCLITFVPGNRIPYGLFLALVSSFVLYFIVPVETENKPLSDTEVIHYKRKARLMIGAELGLTIAFYLVSWYVFSLILSLSLTFELIIALAGLGRKKDEKS
jgi:accessory gene regulator B